MTVKGNPYLHEIFKAIIRYEYDKVWNLLAKKFEWNLLKNYEIEMSKDEIPLYYGETKVVPNEGEYVAIHDDPCSYADVTWFVRHRTKGYTSIIFHEVKTGKYNVSEVVGKYFCNKTLHMSNEHAFGPRFLFIWAWQENHMINIKRLSQGYDGYISVKSRVKSGHVRFVPLELIAPMAKRVIKDLYESYIVNDAFPSASSVNYDILRKPYRYFPWG